ncbi:MAG: RNA polymerase-associated protein RapA [Desulfovibrio sp.]
MELFDNITKTVKDDLKVTITSGSRLSIAAACFSIYAYSQLKKHLENIEELKFIFTSPAFIAEKTPKEKREFYIPRLNRERSLYSSEFEVKLRNELTQKAIAKECANWIKSKVTFKSNITKENMGGFFNVRTKDSAVTYMPINGFTTVDLGYERGNNSYSMITKLDMPHSQEFLRLFENLWNDKNKLQDVTAEVIDSISAAYSENSPELIYIVTLYNIFNEFLDDISEDVLPNEATGFKESRIWNKLYNFQKDAALAAINKLEKFNGCILADSVGLGKTFTALSVIKYYENRNRSVLVLCPKKLADNWITFKANYINNPIAEDRLRYDVLFHTDLSRASGQSGGLDLERLNWGNYDLVVIDESHNFRNGGQITGVDSEQGERENRYLRLLNKVVRAGVKTKVLMLSATPVNNRFIDLKNQLALAYEGKSVQWKDKLNISSSIDEIFRTAQKAFNAWSRLEPEERTTEALLHMLDFDFFEVLDSVTIARSRKHIEKYYNTGEIGKFPERLKPLSLRPKLTNKEGAVSYNQIYASLTRLNLEVYSPSSYIFPSKLEKYAKQTDTNLTQTGREQGIRRLMGINLLKRLESSVYSFRMTLARVKGFIAGTIAGIDEYEKNGKPLAELIDLGGMPDFDLDDQNTDIFVTGRRIKIDLADMDYKTWRIQLENDLGELEQLTELVDDITPEHDAKLQTLLSIIDEKQRAQINPGNKKILIFTAFSDTAEYLYAQVSRFARKKYNLHSALVTGSTDSKTTIPKFKGTLNNVLTCFSPLAKDKALLMPGNTDSIDILIATDCISEGQNLQDCDYLVNYDIHWNPVRIIQRFGRIDRIGSRNQCIQLVNFWPDLDLDEYINLKGRVETRMKISVMTSTGDDDLINAEEQGDLEYRKRQLERLQNEVVDLEEMSSGISIMDLGLNEFRLDLLDYVKNNGELDAVPYGMSAVVSATPETPPGVIFVLRNINGGVNVEDRNRLHPFYIVYIDMEGNVMRSHLAPKNVLDAIRLLCKGKAEPDMPLCRAFNKETKDGKDMRAYSSLLGQAISSMMEAKAESDIDSLFRGGGTTALVNPIHGLDDFELICFLVVR